VITDHRSIAALAAPAEVLDDLRVMTNELLERSWSVESTLALLDTGAPAWSPEVWKRLCEAGWHDLLVDEAAGGGGAGAAELCVIAEALGRIAVPAPFVPVAVARSLVGPGDGDDVPAVLLPRIQLRIEASGSVSTVSGQHPLVAYGDLTTSFVVLLDDGDDVAIARIPADRAGVTREPVRPLDAMPSARVTLDAVEITDADVLARGPSCRRQWAHAEALTVLGWAAELTGIAAGANELATAYAKERIAFGRPIGTFQAIKHRLVDQRGDIEIARALVARAAGALDADATDADAMVALAAFWAVDTLHRTPEGAIQVFGGIGYTWEHPAHVFLRRSAVLTALLGERSPYREQVTEWLEGRTPAK
jgi:alkylation response protein AidB-like acyl-CoA dehydrogenase